MPPWLKWPLGMNGFLLRKSAKLLRNEICHNLFAAVATATLWMRASTILGWLGLTALPRVGQQLRKPSRMTT